MRRGRGQWTREGTRNRSSSVVPSTPDDRRRDSDVSSVQSFGGNYAPQLSNSAMLRYVNAYLASTSCETTLKPPLPSNRDIHNAVVFLMSRIQYSVTCHPDRLLEDEFAPMLKSLNCPVRLHKSAFKTPATPHAWPSFISALYWFVQFVRYNDHLYSTPSRPFGEGNDLISFTTKSYCLFINGDDEAVEALDQEQLSVAQSDLQRSIESVELLENEAVDLELKLETLRSGPTPKEAFEKEKGALVGDVEKYQAVLNLCKEKLPSMEEEVGGKQKELEVKEGEIWRISDENRELKARVDSQTVNVWDVERMQKELQAVESDIAESQTVRTLHEDKKLELDAAIRHKFADFVSLTEQCNDAINKLKLGIDFEFVLNAEGSTPKELLGADYKSVLKPALKALAESSKEVYLRKTEEKVSLERQCQEKATILTKKREQLAGIQSQIEEANARLDLLKKGMEDHVALCDSESRRIKAETDGRVHQMEIVEKEANEFLKNSEKILQDTVNKTNVEIQKCAQELLTMIDSIARSKEHIESVISGMNADLLETAKAVADLHNPLPGKSSRNKRVRTPSPNKKTPDKVGSSSGHNSSTDF